MVQIIAGKKGKGKTKYLLDQANAAVQDAKGSIVYLDKSTKHMYELNNKVRLINVKDYPVNTYEAFIGFLVGIISQDHDLEKMYLDSFLKIADLEGKSVEEAIDTLKAVSDKFSVDFVLSISLDGDELPDNAKELVVVSL
ncbi:hypothetical protein P261_00700 [Lachnospiraceae bacterium TWA4]|nr:hypothetical protein P261_00700 [Lachnospiraceae bacterium TWA4]